MMMCCAQHASCLLGTTCCTFIWAATTGASVMLSAQWILHLRALISWTTVPGGDGTITPTLSQTFPHTVPLIVNLDSPETLQMMQSSHRIHTREYSVTVFYYSKVDFSPRIYGFVWYLKTGQDHHSLTWYNFSFDAVHSVLIYIEWGQ